MAADINVPMIATAICVVTPTADACEKWMIGFFQLRKEHLASSEPSFLSSGYFAVVQ